VRDPRAVPALIASAGGDTALGTAAREALRQIGPAALPPLVTALGEGRPGTDEALLLFGPSAVPAVTALLMAGQAGARKRAAGVLSRIAQPGAAEALLCALEHKDLEVHAVAVETLAGVNDPRVVPALVKVVQSGNGQARGAARALSRH